MGLVNANVTLPNSFDIAAAKKGLIAEHIKPMKGT